MEARLAARIGSVGAAAEHGDRRPSAVERPRCARESMPLRQPADDDHPGARRAARQPLATPSPYALARRAPTIVTARVAQAGQAPRRPAAEQRGRGLTAEVAQRLGVAGSWWRHIVQHPPPRRAGAAGWPGRRRGARRGSPLPGAARRRARDARRPAPAAPGGAGPGGRWRRARCGAPAARAGGRAQALVAGRRSRRRGPAPQGERVADVIGADAVAPSRSAIVRATRSTRS